MTLFAPNRQADARVSELFRQQCDAQYRRTSRMFVWLMLVQWLAAVAAAGWVSPHTWIGVQQRVHQHVWLALVLGGLLSVFPIVMGLRRPTATLTRQVMAVSQMLYSALLIHLMGGRIETHFHVFGSLAFLAFYRDWRVLATATVVVAGDHFVRGVFAPLSVFGSPGTSPWRWVEHAGWVVFEDIVLFAGCAHALAEMRRNAADRAALERSRDSVEAEVRGRTAELAHAAEALRTSEAQIRLARDLSEAANRAKSEFLANMSHEIRTPMTAILGFGDMLRDPTQTLEQREECVRIIRRNGEHLLALINDILDISKIEAGKMTVEKIDCDPAQLVEEAFSLMNVRAAAKGLHLRLECQPDLPVVVTDPLRLRQVLVNLIGNAIKFTEEGRVTIRVAAEQASNGDGGACTLRFEVEDSGIGMSSEQTARLFEAFAQADASTTRRFGGTGLGLMISRRLTEMLGGDIQVRSEEGRGSTFTVTLPCAVGTGHPRNSRAASTTANPGAEPPVLTGRILLAEDGPDNQRLFAFILRKAGASVEIADNGRLAVDAAVRSEQEGHPFDLILMDMQMPELDGYGAAAMLRSKGWKGPIVALTAHAMSSDREKCISAGCDDYLTKPVDRFKMLSVCEQHLRAGRGAAA